MVVFVQHIWWKSLITLLMMSAWLYLPFLLKTKKLRIKMLYVFVPAILALYALVLFGVNKGKFPKLNFDLSYMDLNEITGNFSKTGYTIDLKEAKLQGINLSNSILRKADLSWCDLSGAILFRTDLSYSKMTNADFSGTKILYTNLSYCDLGNSNLKLKQIWPNRISPKEHLNETTLPYSLLQEIQMDCDEYSYLLDYTSQHSDICRKSKKIAEGG